MEPTKNDSKDYYRVLNLPKNASLKDIREAYFRLKNTYNNTNQALYSLEFDEFLPDTINLIEQSYQTLINDSERLKYDEQLVRTQGTQIDELKREHRFAIANKYLARDTYTPYAEMMSAPLPALDTLPETKAPEIKVSLEPLSPNTSSSRSSTETQKRLEKIIEKAEEKDGFLLRKLREELGIDKQLIQEHIKVSISYIEHIEENRYSQLPQAIYVKGFIRSYLKFLGIRNQEHIVNAYIEKMEHS